MLQAHHRGIRAAAVGAIHGHGQILAGGQLQRQVGGVRHLRARTGMVSRASGAWPGLDQCTATFKGFLIQLN